MILFLSLLLLGILGFTIYSLTNHKDLYREAEELARTVPIKQLQKQDRGLGGTIWACFLAGALLTGAFAVQFFAGADDPNTWTTSQFVYAGIGCIMTLAITMAQKSLYSSIHTTKAGLLITFLILLFVIFSEIATSSERTDLLVKHRSESSQVYQGVVKEINRPTAPANVNTASLAAAQAELADAQYELSRCDRHASKGAARVERCQVYEQKRIVKAEGRIRGISRQNEFMTTSAQEMKLKLVDKAKELQYDEEQNPAIIKFLKAVFGGEILYSMILASLIAVVAFESAFHFSGTRRAVIRHAMLLKQNVNDEIQQPAPSPAPVSEPKRWNDELAKSGVDSPADPAMNQHADSEQIERIVERGQSTAETVPGTVSEGVPGTPEKGGELTKKRFYKLIYTEVRRLVLDGHVKPTVRPVTDAVTTVMHHKGHILGLKPSDLGKPKRQQMAQLILEHLEQEEIIHRNAEGGVGKPKYMLAEKYVKAIKARRKNGYVGTEEEQAQLV